MIVLIGNALINVAFMFLKMADKSQRRSSSLQGCEKTMSLIRKPFHRKIHSLRLEQKGREGFVSCSLWPHPTEVTECIHRVYSLATLCCLLYNCQGWSGSHIVTFLFQLAFFRSMLLLSFIKAFVCALFLVRNGVPTSTKSHYSPHPLLCYIL